jgi:hypothetical protein
MNRGYVGYSRSVRSAAAMAEGKMTATDFAKWVRRFARYRGCTAVDVAAALESTEWHHTSKRFNRTNYYDPRDMLDPANRAALADRIATGKSAKNGSLIERFTAECESRGLTPVKTYASSKLIHAVDSQGKSLGWCQTEDEKMWGRKAGIKWT